MSNAAAWKALKLACAERGVPVPIAYKGSSTQMIEQALASVVKPIVIIQEPIIAPAQPIAIVEPVAVAQAQPIVAPAQPIAVVEPVAVAQAQPIAVAPAQPFTFKSLYPGLRFLDSDWEKTYIEARKAIAAELQARVLPVGIKYTKFTDMIGEFNTLPQEQFDHIINGILHRSRGLDEAAARLSQQQLHKLFDITIDFVQRRREYEIRHAGEIRIAREKAAAAELARIEAQRIAAEQAKAAALAPAIKRYGDSKTIIKQAALAEQLLATSDNVDLQNTFDSNRARILGYPAAEWCIPRAQNQIGAYRPKVAGLSYKTLEEASQTVHPTRGLVVRHESDYNKFYTYTTHNQFVTQLHKLAAEDHSFHEVLAATHQNESEDIHEHAYSLMQRDVRYEEARLDLDDLRAEEKELLEDDDVDQDELDALSERITMAEDQLTCMEEDMFIAAHKYVCMDTADARALVLDIDGKDIAHNAESDTIAIFESAYKAAFTQLYMQSTEYEQLFKTSAVCANPKTGLISGLDYSILNNSGLCHSKSGSPYKFSINIRSNHYTTTPAECRIFAEKVRELLPTDLQPLVDMQIYSKARHFRLPYQTKFNDLRPSRPIYNPTFGVTPYSQMLVSAHHKQMAVRLPFVRAPVYDSAKLSASTQTIVGSDIMQKAAALVDAYVPRGFTFHKFQGSMIKYRRRVNTPGVHCDICERNHDTENFFYAVVNNNQEVSYGCFIYSMYYKDVNKRIDAGEVLPAHLSEHLSPKYIKVGRIAQESQHETHVAAPPADTEVPVATAEETEAARLQREFAHMEQLIKAQTYHRRISSKAAEIYIEEHVAEISAFPSTKTLLVESSMGSGKTQALSYLIKNEICVEDVNRLAATIAKMQPKIIVALSHRESFASELAARLDGFISYKQIKETIICTQSYPRVIVQLESLHRLPITIVPDLLVVDESESIFEQISSPLFRKGRQARIVLKALIDNSKQVICMDAGMSRDTQFLVAARGPFTLIRNTYIRNKLDVKCTLSKAVWMHKLLKDLHAGKRVVVPSNSLNASKVLVKIIERDLPHLKVKLYSGESCPVEKAADIKQVNNIWSQYDVVIYTPTISAGVSFIKEHFDKIYCYFGVGSCGVDICNQMTQRVRNVADKEMNVYVGQNYGYRMSREDVITAISEDRTSLYNKHPAAMQLARASSDRYTPASAFYHEVSVRNILRANRSSVRFHMELVNALKLAGHNLSTMPLDITTEQALQTAEDVAEVSSEVKSNKQEAIVRAAILTEEEAQKLAEAREQLSPRQAEALERYTICKTYGIKPSDLNSIHVEFGGKEERKRYRRIQQAAAGLDASQARCKRALENSLENSDDLFTDLNYRKHAHASGMLVELGYKDILDDQPVKKVDLEARISKLRSRLAAGHRAIASMYGIRCKGLAPDSIFKTTLGYINAILYTMYGIEIKSASRDTKTRDNYTLFRPYMCDHATTLRELVSDFK